MAAPIPTVQRKMLKVKDGDDVLVTVIEIKGRKARVRDPYGFAQDVKTSDLYDADESVASFTGTQGGL